MRPHMLVLSGVAVLLLNSGCLKTEAQQRQPAAGNKAAAARPAPAAQIHGNLRQVMRGILFPNSNVIFAAQSKNPSDIKPAADPTTATDPLASVYGGWNAVENSAIALAEAANLLTIPGRVCSNGRRAPVQNADWQKFVQELRDAGMAAYKAAQAKDTDKITDAAGDVTTACSDCHDKYREKPGGEKDRCM
jgi:Cytochrome C'